MATPDDQRAEAQRHELAEQLAKARTSVRIPLTDDQRRRGWTELELVADYVVASDSDGTPHLVLLPTLDAVTDLVRHEAPELLSTDELRTAMTGRAHHEGNVLADARAEQVQLQRVQLAEALDVPPERFAEREDTGLDEADWHDLLEMVRERTWRLEALAHCVRVATTGDSVEATVEWDEHPHATPLAIVRPIVELTQAGADEVAEGEDIWTRQDDMARRLELLEGWATRISALEDAHAGDHRAVAVLEGQLRRLEGAHQALASNVQNDRAERHDAFVMNVEPRRLAERLNALEGAVGKLTGRQDQQPTVGELFARGFVEGHATPPEAFAGEEPEPDVVTPAPGTIGGRLRAAVRMEPTPPVVNEREWVEGLVLSAQARHLGLRDPREAEHHVGPHGDGAEVDVEHLLAEHRAATGQLHELRTELAQARRDSEQLAELERTVDDWRAQLTELLAPAVQHVTGSPSSMDQLVTRTGNVVERVQTLRRERDDLRRQVHQWREELATIVPDDHEVLRVEDGLPSMEWLRAYAITEVNRLRRRPDGLRTAIAAEFGLTGDHPDVTLLDRVRTSRQRAAQVDRALTEARQYREAHAHSQQLRSAAEQTVGRVRELLARWQADEVRGTRPYGGTMMDQLGDALGGEAEPQDGGQ